MNYFIDTNQKEGNMDNSENLTKTECECSINYESAYYDAMREVDRLREENNSLKNVVKELSKVI